MQVPTLTPVELNVLDACILTVEADYGNGLICAGEKRNVLIMRLCDYGVPEHVQRAALYVVAERWV